MVTIRKPTGTRKWCLEVVEGKPSTLRWECPHCKHRWAHQLKQGPRGQKFLMPQQLVTKFARYWSKEQGGCNVVCPRCKR